MNYFQNLDITKIILYIIYTVYIYTESSVGYVGKLGKWAVRSCEGSVGCEGM